jgi:hypothetical protein
MIYLPGQYKFREGLYISTTKKRGVLDFERKNCRFYFDDLRKLITSVRKKEKCLMYRNLQSHFKPVLKGQFPSCHQ